jgi:DNA-directed RNA polymerase specialized sigma24 family protein
MEYVVLRHDSGSTDAEIAETLGLGTGTVKKHLHRASRTLATSLEHVR